MRSHNTALMTDPEGRQWNSISSLVLGDFVLMTIFKLTSCCGCFSIRAGALLVGYLQLLFQIYLSTWMIWEQSNAMENTLTPYRFGVPVEFYLKAAVVGLHALFTIGLLFGLHRSLKGPIKSYLIFMALAFIILFTVEDEERNFIYQFMKNSSLMILMFFWLVIASYYYQMDDFEADDSKISNV